MGLLTPETWIYNKTEDKMVLITEDELGFRLGVKWIDSDGHVYVGYRKGIDRIGSQIHFWVHPEDRFDLRGPKIMPIDVFGHADIDVVYKLNDGSLCRQYEDGALVGFEYKDDSMFHRIGLVRRFGGIYDSFAKFGKCYHAPQATDYVLGPGEGLNPPPMDDIVVLNSSF